MNKRTKDDPVIVLLTGLGVNYKLLYPYRILCGLFGWKCEIVKNSWFTTDDLNEYSKELVRVVDKYNSVITVGFSLGGLATTNALYKFPHLKEKIIKAYTVCSPIRGRNQGIMDSKLVRTIMTPGIPKIFLSKSISGLRHLGDLFDENKIFEKIAKHLDAEDYTVCSYYHENDYLVLPEQATLSKSEKKKIKYNYKMIPKVFHHHMACSDPRIFLDILSDINNKH